MKYLTCLLIAPVFLLTSCATIIGDKTQTLPISSSPSEANISITDETGAIVFNGFTPTSVTLQKSDGSYWGGKSFSIELSKEGYETQVIEVDARANGWYIAGNLAFGGIIGWFIVDPFTGAMYTLSPEDVNTTLDEDNSSAWRNTDKGESIYIVLLEDVPQNLRTEMVQIN